MKKGIPNIQEKVKQDKSKYRGSDMYEQDGRFRVPQMMRQFKSDKINSVQSDTAFTFKASSRGGEDHP